MSFDFNYSVRKYFTKIVGLVCSTFNGIIQNYKRYSSGDVSPYVLWDQAASGKCFKLLRFKKCKNLILVVNFGL